MTAWQYMGVDGEWYDCIDAREAVVLHLLDCPVRLGGTDE